MTQKEVTDLRLLNLLVEVIGVDFGSLWWVPDTRWKESMPSFIARLDNAHPGLSICRGELSSPYQTIPMLIGVSSTGPIGVKGISKNDPDRVTHFGNILRPAHLSQQDLITRKGDDPSETIDKVFHKPQLSSDERQRLLTFLKEKGLV